MQDNLHKNRRSIRLSGYDYTRAGAYYVTICVHDRKCVFGNISNGEMLLNEYGLIVKDEWVKTEHIRKNVGLDVFVIMPNHFHGIVYIFDGDCAKATQRVAPTSQTLKSNSVGAIIGQFKSITTKNINRMGIDDFKWQRNYYEHIIRNDDDLSNIQEYIINNPLKWELDRENPENISKIT